MSNVLVTVLAYFIDRVFGEFRFIKHPIIVIGEYISFFTEHFYRDSIFRGFLLVGTLLSLVSLLSFVFVTLTSYLVPWLETFVLALVSSMFIAHKMLRDAVLEIASVEDKKGAIAMLVSRDTEDMSESDIYKAAIETYAENLSDGVVAPLLYLLLFGLPGIVLYKSINTMDSMVGYRNEKYERFGKVAAILDDIVNYIPSRITALIIMLLSRQKNLFSFYKDGKKHDSPNAGHPITAMALHIGKKLGGDTSYFGKIKKKSYFGKGETNIEKEDLLNALKLL